VTRSAGLSGAALDCPAPTRHDEGDFVWTGYDRPVTFPVVFQMEPGNQSGLIEADLFLGVCETICIPVKAELLLDPAADPDNEDDAAAVEAAFADLPSPARPDFGVSAVSSADGRLKVEVIAPGDPGAVDFFLAGDVNYAFGPPEKVVKDGKIVFSFKADIPEGPAASGGLHYTLVGQSGAVSGIIPYF